MSRMTEHKEFENKLWEAAKDAGVFLAYRYDEEVGDDLVDLLTPELQQELINEYMSLLPDSDYPDYMASVISYVENRTQERVGSLLYMNAFKASHLLVMKEALVECAKFKLNEVLEMLYSEYRFEMKIDPKNFYHEEAA